jgi:hypothetical protein
MGTMILAEYYEARNSIHGALESYLGADLKSYVSEILVGFADTKIEQFRAMTVDESGKESDDPGSDENGEKISEDDEEMTETGVSPNKDLQNKENDAEIVQDSDEKL